MCVSGAPFLPHAATSDVLQPPVPDDASGAQRPSGERHAAARLAASGRHVGGQTRPARRRVPGVAQLPASAAAGPSAAAAVVAAPFVVHVAAARQRRRSTPQAPPHRSGRYRRPPWL